MKKLTWLIKELVKMYSNQDSFFSKKRIESGIAFVAAQWGLIHWLVLHITTLSVSEISLWASIDLAISGYILTKIQAEKKDA